VGRRIAICLQLVMVTLINLFSIKCNLRFSISCGFSRLYCSVGACGYLASVHPLGVVDYIHPTSSDSDKDPVSDNS